MQQLLVVLLREAFIVFPRVNSVKGRVLPAIDAQVGQSLPHVGHESKRKRKTTHERFRSAYAQAVAFEPHPARGFGAVAHTGVDA